MITYVSRDMDVHGVEDNARVAGTSLKATARLGLLVSWCSGVALGDR